MADSEHSEELLDFFKAMADENRLKIIGLLAQKPRSVQALADDLGLGISTTSHHLSRLSKSGLVAARAEGHYYMYSLQTDALREKAQRMLHEDTLSGFWAEAGQDGQDASERKVLASFTNKEGRITAFPVQEKKFIILLRHVSNVFEPGEKYTEKQVNQMLERFNEDTAMLRRGLVDHGMLARDRQGTAYWRVLGQPSNNV